MAELVHFPSRKTMGLGWMAEAMLRRGGYSERYRAYVREYVDRVTQRIAHIPITDQNKELFIAMIAEAALHAGLRFQVELMGLQLKPVKEL